MNECILCQVITTEPEEEYISTWDGGMTFEILKTKADKGHIYRYMVVAEHHISDVLEDEGQIAIGRLFGFMEKFKIPFTIMEPTHATIKDHWHLVASTLDNGDDVQQILDTKRIEVYFK